MGLVMGSSVKCQVGNGIGDGRYMRSESKNMNLCR